MLIIVVVVVCSGGVYVVPVLPVWAVRACVRNALHAYCRMHVMGWGMIV